jgi:hypothetical protein
MGCGRVNFELTGDASPLDASSMLDASPDAAATEAGAIVDSSSDGASAAIDAPSADGGTLPMAVYRHEVSWQLGAESDDSLQALVIDAAGRTITAGWFEGPMDFAGAPLVSNGRWDLLIAAFDPSGSPVWAVAGGSSGFDEWLALAPAPGGGVFAAGEVSGSASLGSESFGGGGGLDGVVAHVSGAGAVEWARSIEGSGDDALVGVAADDTGNVYVAGGFEGSVDLYGTPLVSAGAMDAVIASFDPAGSLRWARSFGDAGRDLGRSAHVAADGNLYVLGTFEGTFDCAMGTLTSAGGQDVFIASFRPDGTARVCVRIGDTNDDTGGALASDAGHVYAIGTSGTLAPGMPADVRITRVSFDGRVDWTRLFGGGGQAWGAAIGVAPDGVVHAGGWAWSDPDFGGGRLGNAGSADAFVFAVTADGTYVGSASFGGAAEEFVTALSIDGDGTVSLGGLFTGGLDFGGGTLTTRGFGDAFVARMTTR